MIKTSMIVAMLLMVIGVGVSAQAPGPAPASSTDCMSELLTMSDCLTYVEEGSNLTKPDKPCCPELAALVNNSPICLCYLLQKNSTSSYGIEIDLNRALHLPTVCKVETPPASTCAFLGIPVGAPTPSEGPAANSPAVLGIPVGAPTPSEGPAANSPAGFEPSSQEPSVAAPAKTDNGASSSAKSVMAFFVGLVIAFLPTFF